MRRTPLLAVCLLCIFVQAAHAQSLCPAGVDSNKLICVIPQVYGPNGLEAKNPAEPAQFDINFLTSGLSALQSSIARQSALLPLASPSSGFIFAWDPVAKAYVSSPDSFGPILGERADTIGKHHLYLGFDYQYFHFTKLDGQDLGKMPIAMPQTPTDFGSGICTLDGTIDQQTGGCGPIRDVIASTNKINLTVHQFSTFITYGISERIDISVAIPIMNVHFGITSDAVVHHNDSDSRYYHGFNSRPDCPATVVNATLTIPCLNQTYPNSNAASGIGDIGIRVKGTAWKGEMAGVALGADIRTPTGDSLNFLGTGAFGVRPFVIWSRRGRISPHAFGGFEVNGSSKIAGDITTGSEDKIPGSLDYSAGVDFRVTKILTIAGDFVGDQMFQALRSKRTTYTEPGQCLDNGGNACDPSAGFKTPIVDPTLASYTGSFNASYISVGAKVEPFSTFLITGNALIPVNGSGLRPQVVPLVGVSYTF
jgi:Putative MetA-pathway of phenol degradation